MKWVTREFVHVDRTACPWLIKRFVDSKAEFIFVSVEKIPKVVKKENAIPFDALGVELGHHGNKCSFDAIIESIKSKTRQEWSWQRLFERLTLTKWTLHSRLPD